MKVHAHMLRHAYGYALATTRGRCKLISAIETFRRQRALQRLRRIGSRGLARLASWAQAKSGVIQISWTPLAPIWPRNFWTFRLAARNSQFCRFGEISVIRLSERISQCHSNGHNRYCANPGSCKSVRRHGNSPTGKSLLLHSI